jgi:hypothetical protein
LPRLPHLQCTVARAPIAHVSTQEGDKRRQAKQPPPEGDPPSSDIDDNRTTTTTNDDDNRAIGQVGKTPARGDTTTPAIGDILTLYSRTVGNSKLRQQQPVGYVVSLGRNERRRLLTQLLPDSQCCSDRRLPNPAISSYFDPSGDGDIRFSLCFAPTATRIALRNLLGPPLHMRHCAAQAAA